MHITEGWLIFLVAFLILGGVAWTLLSVERYLSGERRDDGDVDPTDAEAAHA
jgi:hypothetical protein